MGSAADMFAASRPDGYVRCSVRRVGDLVRESMSLSGFTVGASPLGCNFQSLMSLLYRWLWNRHKVGICFMVDVVVAVTSRVVGFGHLGIR